MGSWGLDCLSGSWFWPWPGPGNFVHLGSETVHESLSLRLSKKEVLQSLSHILLLFCSEPAAAVKVTECESWSSERHLQGPEWLEPATALLSSTTLLCLLLIMLALSLLASNAGWNVHSLTSEFLTPILPYWGFSLPIQHWNPFSTPILLTLNCFSFCLCHLALLNIIEHTLLCVFAISFVRSKIHTIYDVLLNA